MSAELVAEARRLVEEACGAEHGLVGPDGSFADSLAAAEVLVVLSPWIASRFGHDEDEVWDLLGESRSIHEMVARLGPVPEW